MPITITKIITDEELACMANDLVGFPDDVAVMTAELQRRIDWIISHKVERCAQRIVANQSALLGATRPVDTLKAAKQIIAHPGYKTRDKREADDKAAREAKMAKKAAEAARAVDDGPVTPDN